MSFQGVSRIVFVNRRKSVKWSRNPPSSRRRSIPISAARWTTKSSGSEARRPSADTASRSANRRMRYVSSSAETRIRATGYARRLASWSAVATAIRSDAGPFSSASRTRALPRLRARPYAGSRRISSRLTFSPRTNAEASRRNGYFARRASSTGSEMRGAIKGHGGDARKCVARVVTRAPSRSEDGSLVLRLSRRFRFFGHCRPRNRRGRDAELLHQGGHVPLAPMLDALSLMEPNDIDAGDGHLLPRCGDAHEVALVRSGHRGPDDDLVALGNDVVDRRLAVRERGTEQREPLPLALPARRHPRRRRVVDVILGGRLVNHDEIPAVQHFVVEHLHCRLVLLHAHWFPSRCSPGRP